MADTTSKIHYPTGEDLYQPHTDMDRLAHSIRHIVPVANTAERNALATEYNPTQGKPLYVDRADSGTVERNVGSGWQQIYPAVIPDTGWQNNAFSIGSAFSWATAGSLNGFRRIADVVYGNGTVRRDEGYIGENWVTLGTLADGFRPRTTKWLSSNGNGYFIQIQITSDGHTQARQFSDARPSNVVLDSIIFPVG